MPITSTKKQRYIREAASHLKQALAIVNDIDVNTTTLQELKAAANQAMQAATILIRLEGIVENEQS